MTPAEIAELIAAERVVTVATIGPRGRPHLMPVNYVTEDGLITAWTYARSQKAKNVERDPRATLMLEAGDRYDELRGVMLETDVELIREPERVFEIGLAIIARNEGHGIPVLELPEPVRVRVARQAPKRVGLRFHPTRAASWDHRKLNDLR